LARNHTYMLLFDDGQLSGYLDDEHRDRFLLEASNEGRNCTDSCIVLKREHFNAQFL